MDSPLAIMEKVLETASSVSTPFGLGGLLAAILFYIFKQILTRDFVRQMTTAHSAEVIKLIIERLFIFALVAMILGFLPPILTQLLPPPKPPVDKEQTAVVQTPTPNLALTLSTYLSEYSNLASSWRDQEDFVKRESGKPLNWTGIVTSVTNSGLTIAADETSASDGESTTKIFVDFPEVLRQRLSEFSTGQTVSIQGTIAFNSNYPPGYVIAQRADVVK